MIDERQLEALTTGRAKLLDCTRRGLLKLPGSALKLWLCHWMHENSADESYLSVARAMEETGLSRNTVETWRAWLREEGWLARTGDTVQPRSGGRFDVYVTTVKDGSKVSPPKIGMTPKNGGAPKSTAPQNLVPEGSSSPSVSGYGSPSPSPSFSASASVHPPAAAPDGERQRRERLGGKPQPGNRKPKAAPDGTPYPDGFNAWTNVRRTEWLVSHGLSADMNASAQARQEKPKRQSRAQREAAERLADRQTMEMLDRGLGNELDGDPEIGECDNVARCGNWASRYDGRGERLCEDCMEEKLRAKAPTNFFEED
jgi:hypothetical protein